MRAGRAAKSHERGKMCAWVLDVRVRAQKFARRFVREIRKSPQMRAMFTRANITRA
jgi:hypothetical protein